MFNKLKNVVFGFVAGVMGLVAGNASAAGTAPDFTTLTSGIDFSTIGPAILSIAVLISGVYVTWKGAKIIIAAVKGA